MVRPLGGKRNLRLLRIPYARVRGGRGACLPTRQRGASSARAPQRMAGPVGDSPRLVVVAGAGAVDDGQVDGAGHGEASGHFVESAPRPAKRHGDVGEACGERVDDSTSQVVPELALRASGADVMPEARGGVLVRHGHTIPQSAIGGARSRAPLAGRLSG